MAPKKANRKILTEADLRSEAEGQRFLSRAEVLDVVGVTYPALWQWMREGKFPLARELGERRVGWLASEVRKWMESRPVRKVKEVA